jgi:SAM-dependent methyltransferase
MRRELVQIMACPDTGEDLTLEAHERDGDEIITGILRSAGGRKYPIVRGIPRMNMDMEQLESVKRSFGYEWKAHHAGRFERETLFGRTYEQDWEFWLGCMGVAEERIAGLTVLDAGCGSGRFTRLPAEHGARMSIGIDINEAVDEAYASCRDLPNVHFVQANIFKLPFRPGVFDLVWCSGVIHHTPDAGGATASLARHVRSGGSLYVWVYAKRFNPFRFVKDVFDALRISRLPAPVLEAVAKLITYPSWALLQIYRGLRALPGLRPRTAWGHRTVRPRTIEELQLTWFDAISPQYDSRHTEPEVIGWFKAAGFRDIVAIDEPKVGVRGVAT